jgi:hypothetical protein
VSSSCPQWERERLERDVVERELDFSALFLTVHELVNCIARAPGSVTSSTVRAFEHTLSSPRHRRQKQSLFLYKAAANGLALMASMEAVPDPLAATAIRVLKRISRTREAHAQRASAEALGDLPLRITGPLLELSPVEPFSTLTWAEVQWHAAFQAGARYRIYGRSFAAEAQEGKELLVVKFLREEDSPVSLHREAFWMDYLASLPSPSVGFRVPKPLSLGDGYLFRLPNLPAGLNGGLSKRVHHDHLAIAYRVTSDYFTYINGHREETGLDAPSFARTLGDCASLLAQLTSLGIVHQAPIPLFHNRVQTQRRADGGLYQWPRAGRLDRWLQSCQYPNLGLTGIRDLEHMASLQGPAREIYQHIGTHLLSLILVAGSYFRNQDPDLFGWKPDGTPVDVRHLFSRPILRELLETVLQRYYLGFVGQPLAADFMGSYDADSLCHRLVDEMGVDRFMEEIFRVADQQEMSDDEFRQFLMDRGVSGEEAAVRERGKEDITLFTGPHLGRFNDRISIPELIQFVSAASALCVADRYLLQRCARTGEAVVETIALSR